MPETWEAYPIPNGDENWLNSTQTNALEFTVESQNTLAIGGVVANIYAEPSNMIIQGPITPSPDETDGNQYQYTVNLQGGIVPAGSYAVRLEVTATDVWGGTSSSNQSYGIDNHAPQITLISPADGAQFAQNSNVNVVAQITDVYGAKSGIELTQRSENVNRSGSGIASVTLTIIPPQGNAIVSELGSGQAVSESFVAELIGTYYINLTAVDHVGNQSVVAREISVLPASGPVVQFTPYTGWLDPNGENELSFTVSSSVGVNVSAIC